MTKAHRTICRVLVLPALPVAALEALLQIGLSHLGVSLDHVAHHHDGITGVLGSASIGWDPLHAVTTPLALEKAGCLLITNRERPFARSRLLQIWFDLIARREGEVRVEELFRPNACIGSAFPSYDLDKYPNDIKDAPTREGGRRDSRSWFWYS